MKIYELKKGDNFKAEHLNSDGDLEITITGKFLRMDGMYAHVMLHGKGEITFLSAMTEVEKEMADGNR